MRRERIKLKGKIAEREREIKLKGNNIEDRDKFYCPH